MSKRIILSIIIMTAVTLSLLQVTGAYFSSRKSTEGSSFSVGTLDLQVGDESGSLAEPFTIENLGDGAVSSGGKTWKITNKGTLPGRLYFVLNNISNNENGCNEPEKEVDLSCGLPGVGEGELGKMIKVSLYLNEVKVVGGDLSNSLGVLISDSWAGMDPVILKGGESVVVRLDWVLDPEYGNEIQSDSLGFDVSFDLTQSI